MTNRFLLFGIISTLITCQTIPKTNYRDKGLNFKITEDFKIVETKTWKRNHATYIKIERRDKYLYANFSVTWLPKKFNLDKELQNFVVGLKEAYEGDVSNTPIFSEIKSAKFGTNDSRQIYYVVTNDGPRIGSYTTFHCDSLTVIIGQHFTPESQAMTERCRKVIEESYSCVGRGMK
ncbi:MAG: hypothetical protein JSS79_10590 [Bacteroidetes bacterium]|nr:hypothetical protein [Bacteroidota bacterium]